jgi:flagellar hook assembly protein FlgD
LWNDPTSGVPGEDAVPEGFGLYQNAPNPFTSTTTIRYSLPSGGGRVRLEIYDVAGRLVSTLVNEMQQGGKHSIEWSGRNDAGHQLPAGIYFQRLMLDNQEISRKMLLAR